MELVLFVFAIQAILGAFDTLYHHEFKERLPWKYSAKKELLIHGIRNFFYFLLFISLGWYELRGSYAWFLGFILVIEIFLTLWDFVVEDKTRMLPASERITHTLLAINYGIILALLLPKVFFWENHPTQIVPVNYGLWSWLMTTCALGVLFWCVRDLLSSKNVAEDKLPFVKLYQSHLKFLVTGGSGFIGSRLCQMLINSGHDVTILTRNKKNTASKFRGKITLIDSLEETNEDYDIIINLAGEPLNNGRWTSSKKKAIFESRINTTRSVIEYIKHANKKPSLLINGSAIGFYGSSDSEIFYETSEPADRGFTHTLCHQWEQVAMEATQYNVRVVCLRTGIVMGKEGGILAQVLFPFDFCLGAVLGTGKQWLSWIHIDDLLNIIIYIINDNLIEGPINGTAPQPVTNKVFTKTLGKAMSRPTIFKIPSFVIKLLFGEKADNNLINGQNVFPEKILKAGYKFQYEQLSEALNQIFNKKNSNSLDK